MFIIAHKVKCFYCEKQFDRDKEPFHQINSRRFAHKDCYEKYESGLTQEDRDKMALEAYIKELFHISTISIRIKKQIEAYTTEYNYTYSGMLRTLKYFYEIKGNSIEKSNGGIGIIPYVYQDAYNYYYSIWLANQKNEIILKDVECVTGIREIHIPSPQRKTNKISHFTFLDEEVSDEQ